MDDPELPSAENSRRCASLEEQVRENPGQALLVAFGLGLLIAMIVRALQPAPKPRSQVKQLLEDIQERLHDLTDPALERLHDFAGESTEVLKKSAAHVNGIHQNLRSLGCRLKNLFQ